MSSSDGRRPNGSRGAASAGRDGSRGTTSGGRGRPGDRSRPPRSRGPRDTRAVPAPPPRRSRPPARTGEEVEEAAPQPEVWIDEGPSIPRPPRSPKGARAQRSTTERVKVDAPELVALVGAQRADRLEGRLSEAATAFSGERFGESRQLLAPIVREVPELAEGRELYGLTLYRLGRWKDAARELDAFVQLSGGSTEQHPVLADCRRALRQYREVDRLWEELRESSPSGALVTEGRIVAAGSLADRGDLGAAIRLLSKGFRFPKRPMDHHLRRAYALADLYERSADVPQARTLFAQVARAEPGFLDAAERAAALQ